MTPDEARKMILKEPGWPEIHIDNFVRARGLCEYCGESLSGSPSAYHSSHTDHINPKGPRDVLENMALSCGRCNTIKKDNLPPGMPESAGREEKVRLIGDWVRSKLREKRDLEIFEALKCILEFDAE